MLYTEYGSLEFGRRSAITNPLPPSLADGQVWSSKEDLAGYLCTHLDKKINISQSVVVCQVEDE